MQGTLPDIRKSSAKSLQSLFLSRIYAIKQSAPIHRQTKAGKRNPANEIDTKQQVQGGLHYVHTTRYPGC